MNLTSIRDLEQQALGEPCEPIDLDTSPEHREVTTSLLRQARRSVVIMSRDLDPPVYDHPEVVEAVKGFVLGSRRSQVRILIQDVSRIVNRGHRLVELARRLPSFITLRVPAKEHQAYNSAFMVVDDTGTVFRRYADRYQGNVNFDDKSGAEDLLGLFNEMWEHARPHPELRVLSL